MYQINVIVISVIKFQMVAYKLFHIDMAFIDYIA